jgi:predicted RNA-binding protein YlqC (UPF0109 family)
MDGTREPGIYGLLLFMVRSLVDRPDDVNIEPVASEDGTIFRTRVHPTDVGKVIGKDGRTVRALQVIIGAAGTKLGRRFNIDVVQEPGQT